MTFFLVTGGIYQDQRVLISFSYLSESSHLASRERLEALLGKFHGNIYFMQRESGRILSEQRADSHIYRFREDSN